MSLRLAEGRVAALQVRSTRPDVARTLLHGCKPALACAAVPRVFSICAQSQSTAAELACAAAEGASISPETLRRYASAVATETVRELAWHTLLDSPERIGQQADRASVAAARSAAAWLPEHRQSAAAIAHAAFGLPLREWLALQTASDIDQWASTAGTMTARFIRRVLDDEAQADPPTPATPQPALLPSAEHAQFVPALCAAADQHDQFSRQPTWQGRPAETGPLARRAGDAVIHALMQRTTGRAPARFVARLRDLALLLAGAGLPAVGAVPLGEGHGVAWVENARGLLIHEVRLDHGRVARWAITAPTEWNFHPQGALAAGLLGIPGQDAAAVQLRAARLVHSLDPCVACKVELADA